MTNNNHISPVAHFITYSDTCEATFMDRLDKQSCTLHWSDSWLDQCVYMLVSVLLSCNHIWCACSRFHTETHMAVILQRESESAFTYKKSDSVSYAALTQTLQTDIRAALINIFILTTDQIAMSNSNGVSYKPRGIITWLCGSSQITLQSILLLCNVLLCFLGPHTLLSTRLLPVSACFQLKKIYHTLLAQH